MQSPLLTGPPSPDRTLEFFHPIETIPPCGVIRLGLTLGRSSITYDLRDFLFQLGGNFRVLLDHVFLFSWILREVIKLAFGFRCCHDQFPVAVTNRKASLGTVMDHGDPVQHCFWMGQDCFKAVAVLPFIVGKMISGDRGNRSQQVRLANRLIALARCGYFGSG